MEGIIRHIGLVVKNLEQSIKFYEQVFNFQLVNRRIEKGKYIEKLTGIDGAEVEWAKLTDNNSNILELIEYIVQSDLSSHVISKPNILSSLHIAFKVKDINEVYEELLKRNLFCNSEPLISSDGKVKVLYAHDPDGILIEIVEEIIK
ncbi:MAG: VOC family protein [Actinobacteria bacterium]|nr:VOC family protein [Actinomycetota bacterium]